MDDDESYRDFGRLNETMMPARRFSVFALVAIGLMVSGCSPKKGDIEAYGYEKFRDEVHAFRETNTLSDEFQAAFAPLAVYPFLNGVILIYKDSETYQEGIYVDRVAVGAWCGNGFQVNKWFKEIGWYTLDKSQW